MRRLTWVVAVLVLACAGLLFIRYGDDNNQPGRSIKSIKSFKPFKLFSPINKHISLGSFAVVRGLMNDARYGYAMVVLRTGKALIVGGVNALSKELSSAEIYDSASGRFIQTANRMTACRFQPAATLLTSGKVLVTGGRDENEDILSSAELYDPETDTFMSTKGSMVTARY